MVKRKQRLGVYQIERSQAESCTVVYSATEEIVIKELSFDSAQQYTRLLNQAYERGFRQGEMK